MLNRREAGRGPENEATSVYHTDSTAKMFGVDEEEAGSGRD